MTKEEIMDILYEFKDSVEENEQEGRDYYFNGYITGLDGKQYGIAVSSSNGYELFDDNKNLLIKVLYNYWYFLDEVKKKLGL